MRSSPPAPRSTPPASPPRTLEARAGSRPTAVLGPAQAAGSGYLTLWPSSEAQPTASNLNLDASGQTRANLATTKEVSCVDSGLNTFLSTSAHVIYDYIGFYGTEALLTSTC